MADKREKSPKPRLQYACLPYRVRGGQVEFMLVTSRETKRWVIPKGWPMEGKKPHASAAREALEEAGLLGQVGREPVGSYLYQKRLKGGTAVLCRVDVFPLAVKSQRKHWPEKGQRTLRWFSGEEAAESVDELELRDLIRETGERLAATPTET
jgi:8-oxo-dGTP pyrophosphatase MutT (NUDIX family)